MRDIKFKEKREILSEIRIHPNVNDIAEAIEQVRKNIYWSADCIISKNDNCFTFIWHDCLWKFNRNAEQIEFDYLARIGWSFRDEDMKEVVKDFITDKLEPILIEKGFIALIRAEGRSFTIDMHLKPHCWDREDIVLFYSIGI